VRLFNLKGRYQPVLDETIVPVTIVEAEAEKQRLATCYAITASVAAEYGYFWVQNPNDSNVRMRLKTFSTEQEATSTILGTLDGLYTAGTTAAAAKGWREPNSGVPVGGATYGTNTTILAAASRHWNVNAGPRLSMTPIEIILDPGYGWMWQNLTAQRWANWSCQWTEEYITI
jgi:hypothetical protein